MILRALGLSIKYALRGIRYTFNNESNFRFQCGIGFVVLFSSILLPLKTWEFLLVVLMTLLVLVLELFNTALEVFADLLVPRLHHQVAVVKDVMAGAVLLTAIGAVVVGSFILGPYLVALIK
jgi:diacylglycerol kinase